MSQAQDAPKQVVSNQVDVREVVKESYGKTAFQFLLNQNGSSRATTTSCCGSPEISTTDEFGNEVFGAKLYDSEAMGGVSEAALDASLGCGVPTAVADLHPGEVVLDLGSGAGADVLISARRVSPGGRAIGIDMTPEMIELSRRNAREAEITNVEFLEGYLEQIPLSDQSVDVVISNCVLNLTADKNIALGEVVRVLRPGGRFAVSDVISDADMAESDRTDMAKWTGCIAGALTELEYRNALTRVGLVNVEITETHRVHAHAASAIIRAEKPCIRR